MSFGLESPERMSRQRGNRRVAVGTVTSDRMDKTIVVQTVRHVPHRAYGKYVKRYTRYRAHDEKNEARVGDVVELMESRPLSKTKAWRLARVVQRASVE